MSKVISNRSRLSVEKRLKFIDFLESGLSLIFSWTLGILFAFILIDFVSQISYLTRSQDAYYVDKHLTALLLEGPALASIVVILVLRHAFINGKKSVKARSQASSTVSVSSKIDDFLLDYEGVLSGKGQVVQKHERRFWDDRFTGYVLYETWLDVDDALEVSILDIKSTYSGGIRTASYTDGYDVETEFELNGDGTGTSKSRVTTRRVNSSWSWGLVNVVSKKQSTEIRVRDEESARVLHKSIMWMAKNLQDSEARRKRLAAEVKSGNLANLVTREGYSWESIHKTISSLDREYLSAILGKKLENFLSLKSASE